MFRQHWKDLCLRLLRPIMLRVQWRPPGIPLEADLLKLRFGYEGEDDIKKNIVVVSAFTMTTFERLATLWQQVLYLDRYGIEGDLVECGVWKGGAAGMMALAHKRLGAQVSRKIHLFDSFEGLPQPQAVQDGQLAVQLSSGAADGKLTAVGKLVASIDDCKQLLEKKIGYPSDLIEYHCGWFQDTVPVDAEKIEKIALLRLDGDWYESTKICLDHLYKRVTPGGIVVIDDYGFWPGCRQATDEFLQQLQEPVYLQHVDADCRAWVKFGGSRQARASQGTIYDGSHCAQEL